MRRGAAAAAEVEAAAVAGEGAAGQEPVPTVLVIVLCIVLCTNLASSLGDVVLNGTNLWPSPDWYLSVVLHVEDIWQRPIP